MLANVWFRGAVQGLSPVWRRFWGGNASKWVGKGALGMLANVWFRGRFRDCPQFVGGFGEVMLANGPERGRWECQQSNGLFRLGNLRRSGKLLCVGELFIHPTSQSCGRTGSSDAYRVVETGGGTRIPRKTRRAETAQIPRAGNRTQNEISFCYIQPSFPTPPLRGAGTMPIGRNCFGASHGPESQNEPNRARHPTRRSSGCEHPRE
jgi:hypothetical protein